MNENYYGPPLSADELQRQLAAQSSAQTGQRRSVGLINVSHQEDQAGASASAMPDISMTNTDSLDDIISQNTNELYRRRSVPQHFANPIPPHDEPDRRLSMLELGSSDFQNFDFASIGAPDSAMGGGFAGMGGANLPLQGQSAAYPPPSMMAPSDSAGFNLSHDVMGNMTFPDLNLNQMTSPTNNVFPPDMANQFMPAVLDAVDNDFVIDINMEGGQLVGAGADDSGGLDANADDVMTVDQAFGGSSIERSQRTQEPRDLQGSQEPREEPQAMNVDQGPGLGSFQPGTATTLPGELSSSTALGPPLSQTTSQGSAALTSTTGPSATSSMNAISRRPPPASREKTLYSKSGFDMLRALWYVATRPNPQVQLGAVDMSCAFVVCDVDLNDCPIIYVSDNFQNLTGYSKHEIVGQNCRFLQAPNGKVEAGSRREFVENNAVYNLRRKIEDGLEVQQSLINYRKGGKPFLNMLTMIPIPWDNTNRVKYFIGFQIDLVECPDAISGYDQGAMQIDYKQSHIDQYIWNPPTASQLDPENGHTLGIDDVSTLLHQFNPRGVSSDWHKQSWDKMLLENTDDVIHVLSLKGLFLYLSPSCKKVLEYDSTDLVGNSLSSICHPSDIVPVTRELKETSLGSTVNIVFRIRRKQSGYTWFESHGSLFVEQGKGRKCIILVGRKRPVFALPRKDLESFGGIGDSEFWTKISTAGMFLFVSSNVRSLLDLLPESLEGTSMQELMRKESRPEFGRSIEKARRGKIVTCKHEVQNKRGQVLQAQTILYPGDVPEGQKPTFLIAQTKLLKASSRAIAPATAKSGSASAAAAAGVSDEAGNSALVRSGKDAMLSQLGGVASSGAQEVALTGDDNVFVELKTTRATSWQYELRQMEKQNRTLAEELAQLLSNKKKRKRRKGGNTVRDCANCHTRNTPEWRRGPSGNRDLCNSCGLRWAKQVGRVSPRNSSRGGNGDSQSKTSNSPIHSPPLHRDGPTSQDGVTSVAAPSGSSSATGNSTVTAPVTTDGITASSATAVAAGPDSAASAVNPPQSQPLLAGGSGLGGGGMHMTAIREERENST